MFNASRETDSSAAPDGGREMASSCWTFCLRPQADSHHTQAHACMSPDRPMCRGSAALWGLCGVKHQEASAPLARHGWVCSQLGFPGLLLGTIWDRRLPLSSSVLTVAQDGFEPGVPLCCSSHSTEKFRGSEADNCRRLATCEFDEKVEA
jgi:hypothetical protein